MRVREYRLDSTSSTVCLGAREGRCCNRFRRSVDDGLCCDFGRSERSEVARKLRPVGVALLKERVSALDGLVCHVRQSRCLAGEHLLTHQTVVEQIEGE